MAKKNETKYELKTFKSVKNGWDVETYSTLAEARSVMCKDYDKELNYCIERGEIPTQTYISTYNAYIVGARKCEWQIKEIAE